MGIARLAPRPGERVLEIGSGTGHGLAALASGVGAAGRVYGLDLSDAMLRLSRAGLAAAPASTIGLVCGDGVALPYADACMDAVLMSFTLELFDTPDIPVVLGECRRVLRYPGRLCVVAMSRPARLSIAVRLYEWAHARLPNYVDCRPIHPAESMERAGFALVTVDEGSMFGLPVQVVLATQRLA
jgi:demethylmenaquinone methyltransferase/2-methoxy-6-polyprenyl-1,4-benzoquinol methylase